jgi:predicted transposase YbfD/YdcC
LVDGRGRFLGSALTPDKTNEIPVARELLARVNLADRLVLADALHTCQETARQIHFEQGGDYLLTVKGNQKDLHQTVAKLFEQQPFSPSAHGADPGPDTGT